MPQPGSDTAPVIIIPAYQPTARLIDIVGALSADPQQHVIVVDDGSTPAHSGVFSALPDRPRVHILRHAVNLGKGQALKTAFNHFLVNFPEASIGVVTADADGQHVVSDIRRVAAAIALNPTELVLGSRALRGPVPWKSAVGNTVTRHLFHALLGRKVKDTQTGLRGIPRALLADLLRVPTSGYEFELDMLVKAVQQRVRIREVSIQTVYEDGNRGSHFNPVVDSIRIYFVFLRFAALSLLTAALDFAVFAAGYVASANILLSTATARSVAGLFNFYFARRVVFKSHHPPGRELLKYVGLVISLMIVSYAVLTGLVVFVGLSVYISKVVAETALFLASFAIQRLFVFGRAEWASEPDRRTDWDAYYTRPVGLARLTRRITGQLLLSAIRRYHHSNPQMICELGGANSSFYALLRQTFPRVEYMVIDANAYGLQKLRDRCAGDRLLETRHEDVLGVHDDTLRADIVFSVGLIEHFSPPLTAAVIQKHFSCVRPGGLVIITFPTPTWPYTITRIVAEQLGAWHFPDERPLEFVEVETQMQRFGTIVDSRTNWAIVLTQGIVVARAW